MNQNQHPRWKRRLAWGMAMALALGVGSVVVDEGGSLLRLGAVIAITGITLTLAAESHLRIEEIAEDQQMRESILLQTQREVAAALAALGAFTDVSEQCRTFMVAVSAEWKLIESKNSLLLGRILEDHQLEFRSRMHALSNGEVSMDRRTFMQFRSLGLRDLASMHGTSAVNPGYWRTHPGIQYLANQKEAISAGLKVRRILVLPQDEIADWLDVVRNQQDAGVRLTLVIREEVETDDLRFLNIDRFVIKDRGGVQGALFHSPEAEAQLLTNDEAKIRETERILENLRAYEHQPAVIYPELA